MQFDELKRRELITLLGAAWQPLGPCGARAASGHAAAPLPKARGASC